MGCVKTMPIISYSNNFRVSYRRSPDGKLSLYSRSPAQVERDVSRDSEKLLVSASSPPCQSRKTSGYEKCPIKPGWGLIGRKEKMQPRQAKNLRERVAGIEYEYGKENCRFLTATLPSCDPKAFRALAQWSSWLVDRLNEWLVDLLGKEHARVFVWEYQKRGALHLHGVVAGRSSLHLLESRFKEKWIDLLMQIGLRSNANMFLGRRGQNWLKVQRKIRVRVEKVTKSCASYLAKYLSKSSHQNEKALHRCNKKGLFYCIASWCSWNRNATQIAKKYTTRLVLGYCNQDILEVVNNGFKEMLKPYIAEGSRIIEYSATYTSGVCAIIPPENWDKVDSMLEELSEFTVSSKWSRKLLTDFEVADIYTRQFLVSEKTLRQQVLHEEKYRRFLSQTESKDCLDESSFAEKSRQLALTF